MRDSHQRDGCSIKLKPTIRSLKENFSNLDHQRLLRLEKMMSDMEYGVIL